MRKLWRLFVIVAVLALALGTGITSVSAQGSNIVYVVQFGDTLSEIAVRYNTTLEALIAVNNITNPGYIYVGQRLTIPATGGPVVPVNPRVHVVQSGENLFRIGLRYGYDVTTMAAVNGLPYPYTVYIGQLLLIPQIRYHTVQSGEYVAQIARYYGSTMTAILNANNIPNPNLVYPGQVLLIP
jgi:LysM repeat protein